MKKLLKRLCNDLIWLNRCKENGTGSPFFGQKDKIIIIGNGPSAKRIDFEYYKNIGYEFLCVNHFASNSDNFFNIKPKYYCCIEPRILSSEYDKYEESRQKLFRALNKVDWPMTFICCVKDNLAISNSNIKVCKINKAVYDGEPDKRILNLYSKNRATCGYQNVIAAALYFAISIKCEEILLTGVESDMHREIAVDKENNVYREYVHFYGKECKDVVMDGQINKGELFKYFLWSYKTFYQYNLLSKYAEFNEVPVKNLCVNSFIDVFEKIDAKEVDM